MSRDYFGEVTGLAIKTVVINARTRKEALEKLKSNPSFDCEGVDVHYTEKSRRIIGLANKKPVGTPTPGGAGK